MAETPPLQFEHAEHAAGTPATLACAACGQQIRHRYYEISGRTVCESCRRQLESDLAQGAGPDRFLLAAALGCAAAVAGAVLWYAVEALTGWSVGIIAIPVGYLVGRAVHHGARGRGGWLYQGLAVVLTYLAIVSTYVPAALAGTSDASVPDVVRLALAFILACAAPFLALYYGGVQHILGLLIIFFGLSQAWRMNRRVELRVSGPFRVGAAPPGGATPSA